MILEAVYRLVLLPCQKRSIKIIVFLDVFGQPGIGISPPIFSFTWVGQCGVD